MASLFLRSRSGQISLRYLERTRPAAQFQVVQRRYAPAHRLDYEPEIFDLAIATGFSCYYSLDYWQEVLAAVKSTLKPGGFFVFDAVDPAVEWVEDWEILESYLGAEVRLHASTDWKKTIAAAGGKIIKQQPGELFCLYKVKFS